MLCGILFGFKLFSIYDFLGEKDPGKVLMIIICGLLLQLSFPAMNMFQSVIQKNVRLGDVFLAVDVVDVDDREGNDS